MEAIIQEEGKKRKMETTRGLKDDVVWGICGEMFKEVFEAFGRYGKVFRDELSFFGMKDTEAEGIFGDVDADIEHESPPSLSFRSLSSILPISGGFYAQPTNWELRDRGTNSCRGSLAYKSWSPCPSTYKVNFITGIDIT